MWELPLPVQGFPPETLHHAPRALTPAPISLNTNANVEPLVPLGTPSWPVPHQLPELVLGPCSSGPPCSSLLTRRGSGLSPLLQWLEALLGQAVPHPQALEAVGSRQNREGPHMGPNGPQGLTRIRKKEHGRKKKKAGLKSDVKRKKHPHKMLTEGTLSLEAGGCRGWCWGRDSSRQRCSVPSFRGAEALREESTHGSSSSPAPVMPLSLSPLTKQDPLGGFTKSDKKNSVRSASKYHQPVMQPVPSAPFR